MEEFRNDTIDSKVEESNHEVDFPIDIKFIHDLDQQTARISSEIVSLNETLKKELDEISKPAVDGVGAYTGGVLDACDSIDSTIKTMYGLMAKCEELGKAMEPAGKLAQETKEIRRLLDICENRLASSHSTISACPPLSSSNTASDD